MSDPKNAAQDGNHLSQEDSRPVLASGSSSFANAAASCSAIQWNGHHIVYSHGALHSNAAPSRAPTGNCPLNTPEIRKKLVSTRQDGQAEVSNLRVTPISTEIQHQNSSFGGHSQIIKIGTAALFTLLITISIVLGLVLSFTRHVSEP